MSGRGKGKGMRWSGQGGAKRHLVRIRGPDEAFRSKFKKGAIKRLARRAGVERVGGVVYESVREVMKKFMRKVIRDAIVYAHYANRKTITLIDVLHALKRQSQTLYGFQ
ncbi:histone H4, putative [Perkinsus marinus ATCC 50983]|uniref:Histone H4 n=1 Tax=Perkinsus marinus (strain ATCC 50983 / TXsc) TaxID=423536 RepID=C5KSG9_PERM5|nr:histone H4, putative [Perkinsus marinus ATCC 50983]EER12583.1 histone H4, putative [Perkinsus marinus ATCC 50983]|eukprot:XP_002780788.1 histone H4, putative [Perkinsus marinus ATCC 50983]